VNASALGLPGAPFARTDCRLTTSAFSAGLGAMLSLMGNAKLADGKAYPPTHFAAPDDECQAAWKALWDVDGGFRQLGGFEACMKSMVAWRKGGSKRVLRMYHSEDTVDASETLAKLAPEIVIKRYP